MASTRPRFTTKAAWAAAEAAARRRQADALPLVASADWRGVKARTAARRRLLAEAHRLERIAAPPPADDWQPPF